MKETILTAEQWNETRNLYGENITVQAEITGRGFINRPVWRNRPPASFKVIKNLETGNYHVLTPSHQGK
jgi:hypothetical protein